MPKNSRQHGAFSIDSQYAKVTIDCVNDKRDSLTIEQALKIVFRQMEISGNRPRTISSYQFVFDEFIRITELVYVEDINADSIYDYLNTIQVAKATKLLRLKSIKAVLSRFFDNRWIEYKFWKNIQIRIDKKVKTAASESDIEILLQVIDRSTFIGFRDSVAILLMYKTGIRITTLGELREHHIDFERNILDLDGAVLKNHDNILLPFDDQLAELLRGLIQQNAKIRNMYKKRNDYVFITQNGNGINRSDSSTNAVSKQLTKYARVYGFKNINAHAIRRAFAKNLLNKGANVALISKALGHSDLATTTQYLDLDKEEVATSLRDYL